MLDKDTKKRIDRCRDILVGQLPLPSDQVELITIALIYKFMDDIDEISYRIGGKKEFFQKELKELSWLKIIDNSLGADMRVQKFIQGIETLQKAKHIPELFSSIFKNTFLKFRDGRILKMFLDEINNFKYSHSEELGNAFEYLLMSMGTQGENGQFRTPRHIIDFITEVVDPNIDDTILDPACGTAGFLISAYKHILHKNTTGWEDYRVTLKNKNPEGEKIKWGDKLTSSQRKKITGNIMGYDITPLMVRLSKVNLYLHQFPDPHIFEYDTLTNDSSWGKSKDCILANPPFMTPKGGVTPHSQFRIKANKTEVLFTDYIMEHLSYTGKAGIIVPEGIIFQNTGDYVDLRKWLITENLLWAVASLPANVFQPYSGVKTSILFLDKNIARTRNEILLVKIDNDGFSLGTTRTEIEANDLPNSYRALMAYKNNLLTKTNKGKWQVEERKPNGRDKKISTIHGNFNILTKEEFAKLDTYKSTATAYNLIRRQYDKITLAEEEQATYIKKDNLLNEFKSTSGYTAKKLPKDEKKLKEWFNENLKEYVIQYGSLENANHITDKLKKVLDNQREFNLSFDRGENNGVNYSSFEKVKIADLFLLEYGKPLKEGDRKGGSYPVYASNGIVGYHNEYLVKAPFIVVGRKGSAGSIHYSEQDGYPIDVAFYIKLENENRILLRYAYFILKSLNLGRLNNSSGVPGLNRNYVHEIEIPLPPIEIQKAIVEDISGSQKIIESFIDIIEHYAPTFEAKEDWEKYPLSSICDIDPTFSSTKSKLKSNSRVSFLPMADLDYHNPHITPIKTKAISESKGYTYFGEKDVLISKITPCFENGKMGLVGELQNRVGFGSTEFYVLRAGKKITPEFLFLSLCNPNFIREGRKNMSGSAGQQRVTKSFIYNYEIPVPSLKEQAAIVKDLQEDLATIEATKKLKSKMEAKIKSVINKVWGVEEKVMA